ncbi:hypothetical protein KX816_15470 [Sphingosinicellaceae bacterium]|nr:hypothetical protein KX816_15470 [Sphingosinicellaceae bacterium]
MQVNTRVSHDMQVARLADLQHQLEGAQSQIDSGKRFDAPSDDPVASGIATRLRRTQAEGLARGTAIDAAASRLATSDTTLGAVATLLQRAREIGLAAANVTLNASDRATLAIDAKQLGEQLLDLANTTGADGTPLFGGASGRSPAFARDATGAVAWTGFGGGGVVALGSVVSADNGGPAAFIGAGVAAGAGAVASGDAFALIDSLQAALAAPDATRAAVLAAVLGGLDASVSRVADAQAAVGVRAARLETETTRLAAADLRIESDLTKVEGVDMPSAIARLQRLLTVLNASQASFVKLASLSLWDKL